MKEAREVLQVLLETPTMESNPDKQQDATTRESQRLLDEIQHQNQRIMDLESRLYETLAQANNRNQPVQVVNNTPSILSVYQERRRRTQIPMFKNGNAAEAQQWMEQYERVCKFLGFNEQESLDELDARLQGPAVNWLAGLTSDVRNDWGRLKTDFLYYFGGGAQPSRVALAELKTFKQGNLPMREFGPRLMELLQRAKIVGDELQLDYFNDRVNPSIRQAVTLHFPKTVREAISVATEIEYAAPRPTNTTTATMMPPPLPTLYSNPSTPEGQAPTPMEGTV